MTTAFVKRNSASFFRGKFAKVLAEQENLGGDIIPTGVMVKIVSKNRDIRTDLDIEYNNIKICGISPEYLELIKNLNK